MELQEIMTEIYSWQNADNKNRSVIMMAIDEEQGNEGAAITGKGKNLLAMLLLMMHKQPTLAKLIKEAVKMNDDKAFKAFMSNNPDIN